MLINASAAEEVRMALVEDGVMTDLDVETQSREKSRGNIYKGIVANVEASLGAAFIEFGHAKQGFLAFDDIRPELWDPSWKGEGRPKITDILHRKQEIVVQVIKEEMGSKGAAVTTYLSLPGRYVVLMHSGGGRGGVSRKIDDDRERAKAKELLEKLKVPDGLGVIIRTAGTGKNRAELQSDLNQLHKQWNKIVQASEIARAPSLLYREPDLVVRTIRDYLTPDVDEVLIDSADEYEDALSYFSGGEEAEQLQSETDRQGHDLIKLYEGKVPLFEKYGVEEQIEGLFKRTVPLPSGGYLVIDQTEALVAIDVNSGKSTREEDHESTVYKTNLEAVSEVARQLRLRDMGGIVVVDLIDMSSRKHERDVEQRLKEALKADKARVKVGRISENGLLELTRQRLRQAHRLVSHVPCQACQGTGVIRAVPGQAVAALRELQTRAAAAQGALARLSVRLPLDAANHLANHKRLELDALARQWEVKVEVLADSNLGQGESKFEEERRGRAALQAPDRPTVKDEEWRPRRRYRGGEEEREGQALSIEDRQEQHFREDRSHRQQRGHRGERGERGRWDRRKERESGERAKEATGGRPALVAEDIRTRPEPAPARVEPQGPRHYPDDPLMDALFGDPPEIAAEPAAARAPEGGVQVEMPLAAAGENGTPLETPVEGQAAAGANGEEGARKKRRRRRRRRKGGAGAIDPLTGLPVQPAAEAAAGAEGEDEEEGEEEEGAEATPAAAVIPPPSATGDLLQAATQLLLGQTAAPVETSAPSRLPEAAELEERMRKSPPLSAFLTPTELEQVQEAPLHGADGTPAEQPVPEDAHAAEEEEEEEGEEDLAEGEEAAGLPPLPPPGPPSEDAVAHPDEPTVAAKKGARKARSRTPGKTTARKKTGTKKKASAKNAK